MFRARFQAIECEMNLILTSFVRQKTGQKWNPRYFLG